MKGVLPSVESEVLDCRNGFLGIRGGGVSGGRRGGFLVGLNEIGGRYGGEVGLELVPVVSALGFEAFDG